MIKKYTKSIFPIFLITLLALIYVFNSSTVEKNNANFNKVRSTSSPKATKQSIEQRDKYFFNMLRDPATNRIPKDALKKEMEFSNYIKSHGLRKTNADLLKWQEAGPNDVGGRTRALAIDVRNANIILAGGISGGIWKSTDKGESWSMKFTTSQVLTVSSLAQDTRSGQEDTWYAASGEFIANSAGENGASFYGAGIYKSIDNGETWVLLPKQDNPLSWDNPLDFVSKISVNPATGSVFIASNFYGIFKSIDGGASFQNVLGGSNLYCELDIASNGNIVGTLSESTNGNTPTKTGVWMSNDDGTNWTNVTPASYPNGLSYNRAVVGIAPSNNNLCYVLVEVNDGSGDNRLFKIDLSSNTSVDLSANLPDFGLPENKGKYSSQGGYDMLVAVKPDDENFVLIGGSSLYRSFDGFSTPLKDVDKDWIGGYSPIYTMHPDIHSFAFEPGSPDKVWIGHDGGLDYSEKITALKGTDYFEGFPWIKKNNSYNVTQVYHIAVPKIAGDTRIMVGCQDNGTPFFNFNGSTTASLDVSSGDGAVCYFGSTYAYVSTQNGDVLQLAYNSDGGIPRIYGPYNGEHYAFIKPINSSNPLFINPFAVDPVSEEVFYYPAGESVWRNKNVNNIPLGSDPKDVQGWEKLAGFELLGHQYTAISASNQNSSHVLYAAATDYFNTKIFRLDNSNESNAAPVDVSIAGLTGGAYVKDIAINPLNSNEIIVLATNYNIVGLYHSMDGGASYTAVEGSLEGNNGSGPSLRSAKILPTADGNIYLVGTSVGLFSTSKLEGANTIWMQEGADVIGNVIIASIDVRTADSYVAVGTHGRGVFTGKAISTVGVKQLDELPSSYSLSQNYPNPFNPTTKIRYSVPVASNISIKIYNSNGEEVSEIVNQYMNAGTFEADWNGTNSKGIKVASGAYIYSLQAGDFMQTKKMLLLK